MKLLHNVARDVAVWAFSRFLSRSTNDGERTQYGPTV